MKLAITAITTTTAALLLSACAGNLNITASDLQHHHWRLHAINGEPLAADIESDLEIGEGMSINGKSGCNLFFGNARLEQGRLHVETLGSTKMACPAEQERVETAVLTTLTQGAAINLQPQTLELKGDKYTLSYQLADWK